MQAIKKVFQHGDSDNMSPSGHFNTANEDYDSSKSAQHPNNTPNHQAPSAPAKAGEKMAGVDPSHAAGALSDSKASSGDNRETGTHVVGSQDTNMHQNPVSSTSNGLDNERSSTGNTENLANRDNTLGSRDTGAESSSHGAPADRAKDAISGNSNTHNNDSALGGSSRHTGSESTSHGGVVGRAEQALGSNHSHKQPKEFTHLDQEHARDATHDHKHLAAVTRSFFHSLSDSVSVADSFLAQQTRSTTTTRLKRLPASARLTATSTTFRFVEQLTRRD